MLQFRVFRAKIMNKKIRFAEPPTNLVKKSQQIYVDIIGRGLFHLFSHPCLLVLSSLFFSSLSSLFPLSLHLHPLITPSPLSCGRIVRSMLTTFRFLVKIARYLTIYPSFSCVYLIIPISVKIYSLPIYRDQR